MARIGYFDCFSGASGDMILGAMLAAGLPEETLRSELARLRLDGYDLTIQAIKKQGFAATKVEVRPHTPGGHRHLHHIEAIIEQSDLSRTIKDTASRIFRRLAEAEARVHGSTIEKVHFHEVGAVDAIVDIVGAAIGVQALALERIICSPIPTGSGTVRCEHGLMPVPAPGTAALLVGVPLAATDEPGELTTPTGAAILTTLAQSFGPLPAMTISASGCGAGTRDGKTRPNILRLFTGESRDSMTGGENSDEIIVLETNLDDASGQVIGQAMEALFAAGALDVYSTPIQMKKNRPGVLLSVLTSPENWERCEEAMFRHTPTFGVRRHACSRSILDRRMIQVETSYGSVAIKIGTRHGEIIAVMPEYEDCLRLARERNTSFQNVYFEAQRAGRSAAQGASAGKRQGG